MWKKISIFVFALITIYGCSKNDNMTNSPAMTAKDPDTAPKAMIDRFSEAAGHLQVRTDANGLPGPGEPVDFDQPPFITQGLGPDGQVVKYYNFDVQPAVAAPIYKFFYEDDGMPVPDQLNIVGVIPGDDGYNDFWNLNKVMVPKSYVANSITSVSELMSMKYTINQTNVIVNCPIVPDGSTAKMRYKSTESTGLARGWYKDMVVFYFSFFEKDLSFDMSMGNTPTVPVSDIYVTFNINPGMTNGGPASGFVMEMGSMQTHNVTTTIPTDAGYSPLWDVDVYDNMDFSKVMNLHNILSTNILARGVALVNCPMVYVGQ